MNISIFRNKNFSLLICGQLVSLLGTKLQGVALSLYILSVTQSTVQFASVLAITMLPNLFLGPFAGVLVDWWDRKKIVVSLDILSGVITLLTAVYFYMTGGLNIYIIYFLSVIFSIIGLLFEPASRTILPSIISKEELFDANSLSSFVMSFVSFSAPLLAGIVYGFYGLGFILVVNGISFIASGISEMFIEIPKVEQNGKVRTLNQFKLDFVEGVQYLVKNEILFTLFLSSLFLNFFYSPIISIGIIHISKMLFKVSDASFGLMQTVLIGSSFVVPMIAPYFAKRISFNRLFVGNQFIIGILFVAMAVTCSQWFYNTIATTQIAFILYTGLMFVNGMVVGVGNMVIGVMVQKITPIELMGRVSTFKTSLIMAVIPVGQLLFGYMFSRYDASVCILFSALALILIATFNGRRLSKAIKKETARGVVISLT